MTFASSIRAFTIGSALSLRELESATNDGTSATTLAPAVGIAATMLTTAAPIDATVPRNPPKEKLLVAITGSAV